MFRTPVLICTLLVVGAAVVPVQAGLQDGLVSYFKLDESSGTFAADSSGNGHDGTLSGDKAEWVPGRFGGAVLFATDVDEAHVEFPTTGMSVTAGSISIWGYLNDPQAARTRYFFGHTTRPPYTNRIQIYMDESTTNLDIGLGDMHARATNIKLLPTKTWVHVVLTWDNGKYVVYVQDNNGAQSLWVRQVATDSNVQIVSPDKLQYSGLTFSGDGNYVFYVQSDKDKPGYNSLFQVPVLGGTPRKLIEDVDSPVALSPDGKLLAFIRGMPTQGQVGLMLANADGSGLRLFITYPDLDYALGSVIEKSIRKLSRGYRQRVGMAQVLLHEPDVLIMDEPTAGLDPNQIHDVRETIRKLGQNKTILLSTHILQEVEAMADRILFIDEGRLVYDGDVHQLTKDGRPMDQRFRELTSVK